MSIMLVGFIISKHNTSREFCTAHSLQNVLKRGIIAIRKVFVLIGVIGVVYERKYKKRFKKRVFGMEKT